MVPLLLLLLLHVLLDHLMRYQEDPQPSLFGLGLGVYSRTAVLLPLAGVAPTLLQNPLDVWKIRLQTSYEKKGATVTSHKTGRSTSILQQLMATPKIFMRGVTLTVRSYPHAMSATQRCMACEHKSLARACMRGACV